MHLLVDDSVCLKIAFNTLLCVGVYVFVHVYVWVMCAVSHKAAQFFQVQVGTLWSNKMSSDKNNWVFISATYLAWGLHAMCYYFGELFGLLFLASL